MTQASNIEIGRSGQVWLRAEQAERELIFTSKDREGRFRTSANDNTATAEGR
jgi:hypothetical protein